MKRVPAILLVLPLALLMSAQAPYTRTDSYQTILQRELLALQERGLSYVVHDTFVEAIDPLTQQRWKWSLDALEPREAPRTGLPTLTIDLRTIDTNLYNWRFRYRSSMPLSGGWGFPLQVGDINRNGRFEAYGVYRSQSEVQARIYEQDLTGQWVFWHQFPENSGGADMQTDIDRNGLKEVYFRYGDSLFVFEQVAPDSLPKAVKFRHRQWYQSATGIQNQLFDMTGNDTAEVVYRGSRLDSLGQPNIEKISIMRYDQLTNNLDEVWSAQLPPGCQEESCTWAIAVGDFDSDGKAEFATSRLAGDVYVVEHVVNDSFALTWSTDLSVAGRIASGDVDGNGITEFIVGGTQLESDGYVHLRAYAFERTGDNTFQPVFHFDIFPTGIFFVDLYLTADVDGDNIPELLISTSGGIIIIKGAGEHNYELFYYQPPFALDGVAAWKINNNRAADLFVSRHLGGQPVIKRTDVYELDSTLVVGLNHSVSLPQIMQLFQNYPNPFNPQTTITYELPERGYVRLTIFDITGKEVITLVDDVQEAGKHHADWAPLNRASGVYLVRLTVNRQSIARKLLHLK